MRKFKLPVLLAIVGGVLVLTAGVAAAAKPSAAPDTVKTQPNTRVVIDVLANDHATGGEQLDPASLNINEFPNTGDLAVTSDFKLAYTPAPGFVGVETFSYLVCSKGSPNDCSVGTVNVTVGNPNATTTTTVPLPPAPAPAPTPAPVAAAATGSTLARTGSASAVLALLGLALCAAGFAMSSRTRREI